MLRCNDCGFERPMLNSLLGTPHGPHCVGSWLEVPDRVYSGGNTSAANPMRVAEEAMQSYLGQLGPQRASQQQTILVLPSAMLIRPDDVGKWELFNAGQGSLAGGADEMDRLRRENLALQAEMKRCHDDNEATRGASNQVLELKEGYRVKNTNLEMVVADLRGSLATEFNIRVQTENELMWAKKEVHRLDPKLASARWGWGK